MQNFVWYLLNGFDLKIKLWKISSFFKKLHLHMDPLHCQAVSTFINIKPLKSSICLLKTLLTIFETWTRTSHLIFFLSWCCSDFPNPFKVVSIPDRGKRFFYYYRWISDIQILENISAMYKKISIHLVLLVRKIWRFVSYC